jgi:pimeloyl-ACP methyl ester carboxylesterase
VTELHLACQSAASRFVQVKGLRLHLLAWGTEKQGLPLCFLHGGSAHAHWFDRVIPTLAERFPIVALDQRGHGESDWPTPPAYATEDFAADLLGVFDALGWDRVVLIGHSMGGHNAMAFAAWYPGRVRALVIVDSRPAFPAERLARLRERGTRALRQHPTLGSALAAFRLVPRETVADPALLAHLARAGIARRDGAWLYRFDPDSNRFRRPADTWTLLDRITAPTLIVRGEWSPVLPPDMAERLLGAIHGAGLVVIPGAYHHLVLDNPHAFAGVLHDFLVGGLDGPQPPTRSEAPRQSRDAPR